MSTEDKMNEIAKNIDTMGFKGLLRFIALMLLNIFKELALLNGKIKKDD